LKKGVFVFSDSHDTPGPGVGNYAAVLVS